MPIRHRKTSTKPDGPDSSQVQPSDWNADHVTYGTSQPITPRPSPVQRVLRLIPGPRGATGLRGLTGAQGSPNTPRLEPRPPDTRRILIPGPPGPPGAPATAYPSFTLHLKTSATEAAATINVNNTAYAGIGPLCFTIDLPSFPFTSFNIAISGNSNQAAQTITADIATFAAPTSGIDSTYTGLVISNTPGIFRSGWRTRNDGRTAITEYQLVLKGSNGTVDLAYSYIDLLFKV